MTAHDLPGLHRLVRKRKSSVTIEMRAWRGRGAPMLAAYKAATLEAAEALARADAANLARGYADATNPRPSAAFLSGLIAAYKASPEWARLAAQTKRVWNRWLDRIDDELGETSVRALDAHGARGLILDWRDGYAATPRAADLGVQVLRRVLNWAVNRELMTRNPALGIADLYAVDRSDLIWEPHHIAAALAVARAKKRPHIADAIELAAHTGLRIGDLVRLTWGAIDERTREIRWRTAKSRHRIEAVIPITTALAAVLKRVPRHGPIVLTSARKQPYATGDTLSEAIQDIARAAGVDRHTHDLRGTAATHLIAAGLSYAQTALVLGWSEGEVERIARRYVAPGVVTSLVAARLNAVTPRNSARRKTTT